jgi:hypothetical protein
MEEAPPASEAEPSCKRVRVALVAALVLAAAAWTTSPALQAALLPAEPTSLGPASAAPEPLSLIRSASPSSAAVAPPRLRNPALDAALAPAAAASAAFPSTAPLRLRPSLPLSPPPTTACAANRSALAAFRIDLMPAGHSVDVTGAVDWTRCVLLWTITNDGFVDMAANWVLHLRRHRKEDKFAIFTTDTAATDALAKLGLASFPLVPRGAAPLASPSGANAFRSGDYNHIVWLKVAVQRAVLAAGVGALLSDTDVAWLADPLESMTSKPAWRHGWTRPSRTPARVCAAARSCAWRRAWGARALPRSPSSSLPPCLPLSPFR